MKLFQISEHLFADYFVFNKSPDFNGLEKEFQSLFPDKIKLNIVYSERIFQAFTHKSFTNEFGDKFPHNEKLEFLGDSVLQLTISKKLFNQFPKRQEGELSKLRSSIVNESSLAKLAKAMNLGTLILTGKGELKAKGFEKDSILSDTYEAVLGAIYLDQGLEAAELFITDSLDLLKEVSGEELLDFANVQSFDSKSRLQEMAMKAFKEIPKYEFEELPNQLFKVKALLRGEVLGELENPSKKKGMQILAKQIIEKNILKTIGEN